MAEGSVMLTWADLDGATAPFHLLHGLQVSVSLVKGKSLEHLEIVGTDCDNVGEVLICKVLDESHVSRVGNDIRVPFRFINEIHIY